MEADGISVYEAIGKNSSSFPFCGDGDVHSVGVLLASDP